MFFPPLDSSAIWGLTVILTQLKADPLYFQDEDCPYPSELVALFVTKVEAEVPLPVATDKWSQLEQESRTLYDALILEGATLTDRDSAEKMAYFRTATSLLEKMVGIQERAVNIKQIHQFHSAVLEVIEHVLDPGQRTTVMAGLKASIAPDV